MNPIRTTLSGLALLAALFTTAACGDSAQASNKPAPTPAEQPAPTPAAPTPEVLAKLAAADAVDGAVDHVIGKCPACNLHMAGKAENELVVGDYKLHFCSAKEVPTWAADPNAKILALALPEQK